MSKHIRPVFAVPEATVALTVAETGGTAMAVTNERDYFTLVVRFDMGNAGSLS
jgi:hypothetical protein